MRERKELRREREKHFENADHSFTAAIYGQPVHFMENGEWKEIDNTVELAADGRYVNKKNDLKVSFAGDASDERLIEVGKDGHSVSWKMKGALSAAVGPGKKPDPKKKRAEMEVTGLHAGMVYKNVLDGVDLEYELRSKTLKENIVLSKSPAGGRVVFEITTDLLPETDGGRILFKTDAGEDVFVMPAPFMFDASGKESHAVEVVCEGKREHGKFLYTLIPDAEWLMEKERQWPVTIDPVISSSIQWADIQDVRIQSGDPNTPHDQTAKLSVGKGSNTGICRSLVNFELPVLKPADMVVHAVFDATCFTNYNSLHQVNVHRVLSAWTQGSVTWNTMPKYDRTVADCKRFRDVSGNVVRFDITDIVKDWYAHGGRYGLMLKDNDEKNSYMEFLGSDSAASLSEGRPRVYIQYVNYSGIQDFWSYHSQDIRRAGTVSVNDYNGNLIYRHPVASITGNCMPYDLELVYNSNDKDVDLGYGRGMRFNYHQILTYEVIDNVVHYKWVDGTGTAHYFKWNTDKGAWIDEVNADCQLEVNETSMDAMYTIKDKKGSRIIYQSGGYPVRMEDADGNALAINFDFAGDLRIQSLVDGANRRLNIGYTAKTGTHTITVTDPAGRKKYLYINNNLLTSIRDFDGKVITLTYNADGLLTSVKNYDGYKMTYTYGSTNPARVSKIVEHDGNSSRRTLTLTRGRNMTEFTDERGRKEYYFFNNAGQTVNVQNDQGYAQAQEFMQGGMSVNKLSKVSTLQKTTAQHMKNPHILDLTEWAAGSLSDTSCLFNQDPAYARYGNNSLSVTSASSASAGNWRQTVTLEKGKTYTYSGYLRTKNPGAVGNGGGALLQVEYNGAGNVRKYISSRKIQNTQNEWEYVDITFTLPTDVVSTAVDLYVMHNLFAGTTYFDCLQIEEGNVGGRRNLMDNNDFMHGLYHFDENIGLDGNDGIVDMDALASVTPEASMPVRLGKVVFQNTALSYVYMGPGSGYPTHVKLSSGDYVRYLGTENDGTRDWYRIRYHSSGAQYEGYMIRDNITLLEEGLTAGTVKSASAYFKNGPGNSYTSLLLLTSGAIVHITGESGDWYAAKAMYNGTEYSGYVLKSSIEVMTTGGHIGEDRSVIHGSQVLLSKNAYCIHGVASKKKRLGQRVRLSGDAGDAYVLSGWGCGHPVSLNDTAANGEVRSFGYLLEFIHSDGSTEEHRADFASSCDQWQFVNKAIVANAAYTAIRVSCVYDHQENRAFFDGPALYKDEYWPSFTYDADGNIQSCADAKNDKTSFEYNSNNDVTKVTTPKGANFTYTYDDRHRVTEAVSGMGTKYQFVYDSYGNVTEQKTVDKNGTLADIRARFTYTDGCYPKEVIDCFGKKVEYTYDKNATGNLTQVKDVYGKTTDYTYDTMDRLLTVKKKNTVGGTETDIIQSYTYENDRLKTITHNGMNYTFTYDALGNMTKVQAGGQTLVNHTYSTNPIGRLTKSVLGNSTGVAYTYDVFDRVTKKRRVNSDGSVNDEYVFTYDNEGRVARINDKVNNNKTYCDYSLAGELAHVRYSTGPEFWYTYNKDNTLNKIRTNLNGKQMSYTYDNDLREVTSKTMNGKTLTTTYDGLGRVTKKRLNTTTAFNSQFGYRTGEGGMSTPVIQTITQGGKTWNYSYHDDGNISQIVYITKDENGNTVTYTNRYQYDALGQLIRVDDQLKNKTILYTYDAGFNMTSEKVYDYTTAETVSGTPESRTFTYASGWKDQLVSVGGQALTYDGAGNLVSYNGRTFTWKNGRQLASTTANSKTVSFTYDHNGMRVSKTVEGVKHTYVYAGTLLLQEKATGLDLKFSYDSLGNPIAILYNNSEYYYVKNLQGDIVGLVNKDGEWVVEYRYDAWGNILSTTGSLATTLGAVNPFRYRGYYYDAETGFYYVSSRYYAPEIGRFISVDTTDILEVQSDLHDKNFYAYCDNNPVMRKDSSGEIWIAAVAVGVATQYAGDVIGNFLAGKTGADIFTPTSTVGEYVAAGVTALIPGSGLAGSLIRNVAAEVIVSVERHIKGQSNSLAQSAKRVAFGTVIDTGMEKVTSSVTKHIESKMPRNYSSYAGQQYKKNPGITQQQIRQNMSRSVRWGTRISNCFNFIANAVRSALPW